VIASDNDPLAVRIAADNALLNRVASLVSAFKARGFDHPRLRYRKADLVLANLLESALYDLAPAIAKYVTPGGRAIVSGLTEAQARTIEARTRSLGFAMEKRFILNGVVRHNARATRD
jgi:ribosomal protein L11 methyltransferase